MIAIARREDVVDAIVASPARRLVLLRELADSEPDVDAVVVRELGETWWRVWKACAPNSHLYWALMPIEEMHARVRDAEVSVDREAERLQEVRGVPSWPIRGKGAARVAFLEFVDEAARGRGRIDSGEHREAWRADLVRWGVSKPLVAAALDGFEPGSGRGNDVANVRFRLRHGMIIGGVTVSLPDVNGKISDDEIALAVDIWSRPPRRPRKGEARLPERWEYFRKLLGRIGLGHVSARSLEDEWRAWSKARGPRNSQP